MCPSIYDCKDPYDTGFITSAGVVKKNHYERLPGKTIETYISFLQLNKYTYGKFFLDIFSVVKRNNISKYNSGLWLIDLLFSFILIVFVWKVELN